MRPKLKEDSKFLEKMRNVFPCIFGNQTNNSDNNGQKYLRKREVRTKMVFHWEQKVKNFAKQNEIQIDLT